MTDTFSVARMTPPIDGMVVRAFRRSPNYYNALVVYLQLLIDADAGAVRTNTSLGDEIGLAESTVKRNLRILRRIGLVRALGAGRLAVVTHTDEQVILNILTGLDVGTVDLDIAKGEVRHLRSGRVFDYEKQGSETGLPRPTRSPQTCLKEVRVGAGNGSTRSPETCQVSPDLVSSEVVQPVSDAADTTSENPAVETGLGGPDSEGSQRILFSFSKYVTKNNLKPISKSPTDAGFAPVQYEPAKIPLTRDGKPSGEYDYRRDEANAARVQEVQDHANQVFKANHAVLVNGRIQDRYKSIHRMLVHCGFTVEQLKAALDECAKDQWWRSKGIIDTTTILRDLANVQRWVDRASGAARRPVEKRDMRALDCAPLPEGVVADSFEF